MQQMLSYTHHDLLTCQYALLLSLSLLKQHREKEQAVLNRHTDVKKYLVSLNGKQLNTKKVRLFAADAS